MTEHEHTYRVYGLEGRESVRCACGDVISEPASVARMAAEHWSSLNVSKDIAPICFRHHLVRDNGPWPCVCRRDPRIDAMRRVVRLHPERPLPSGCRGVLTMPAALDAGTAARVRTRRTRA